MITYRRALHHFFATMAGVSRLGLLLSICMKECSLDVDFEIPGEEQIEGLRPVKRQSDKPVVRFHGNIVQLEMMPTIEEMSLEVTGQSRAQMIRKVNGPDQRSMPVGAQHRSPEGAASWLRWFPLCVMVDKICCLYTTTMCSGARAI